ncbi:MAG: tetratricopeptide repeat protein [Elusimicrobia bacterium]|nr:tetratricopeptide repeat protein [Elusimicrobiota bacterium]
MATARTEALSAARKLGLAAAGLLLTFLILEASLRLAGFALLSLQELRNAASLRRKGVYRIMCIGESTTRAQYPKFLEEALNKRDVGIEFSVIDRGVVGVQSSALLNRLESDLDLYRPDLVVAMMGINDRSVRYYADVPASEGFLFRHLRAYRLACLLWRDARQGRHGTPGDQTNSSRGPMKAADDPGGHIRRGWSYSDRGDYAQAVAQFKKALELDPRNSAGYEGLGESYSSLGQFQAAESVMLEGVSRDPGAVPLCIALGRLSIRQARFKEGEKWFSKALALHPDFAVDEVYFGLGAAHQGRRDFDQALLFFGKALEANPANERAIEGVLWSAYFARGDLSRLRTLLEKIRLKDLSLDDKIYAGLATAYSRLGEPELARLARDRAEKLRLELYSPILVENYRRLKMILDRRRIRLACAQYPMRSLAPLKRMLRGHEEGVIFIDNQRVFREAVAKSSFDAYFMDMFGGDFGHCTLKGNELLARNIAEALLKEGFGSVPLSDAAAPIARAGLPLKSGRRDEAPAALRRAQSIAPKNPGPKRMLGLSRGLKEPGPALAVADRIVKPPPDDAAAQIGRAELLLESGRRDEALAALQRAQSLGPKDADLVRMLGLYRGLKEPDRALAVADRIVKLRPGDAPAHIERAELLLESGRRDEALAALQRAQSIGPKEPQLERMLRLYRGLKEPDRALAVADRIVKLRPGDAPAQVERAELLLESGRRDEALAALQRAESLDPSAENLRRIARDYQFLGDCAQALRLWKGRVLGSGAVAKDYSDQAICEYMSGDREGARADLERAIKLYPEGLEAYLSLGTLYAGQGQDDQALRVYERALAIQPPPGMLQLRRQLLDAAAALRQKRR